MLDDIMAESVIYAIQELFKELEFNRKVEGVITEKIDNSTYKVKIQNNESIIKSMNNTEYIVGDVVYVIIFNNNNSDRKILCKK